MLKKNGFSFIDVLVGVALLLVVFLGIFGLYELGIKIIGQSKARIAAIALANQKIEMARNLSYNSVGTIGGIPGGAIVETENITRNSISYNVKSTIVYIDDSFDSLAPGDTLPSDYKRVKVKVTWQGRFGGEVALVTDVAPKRMESEADGGILRIAVFDAQGLGVTQADLQVVNTKVSPAINAWYQTDDYGDLVLIGAPASLESYQITASKTNYSTDKTYGTQEVANPLKSHLSVYEDQLTETSFSIDRLSSFSVQTTGTKGQGYPPIKNVPFTLRGEKTIGQDTSGNAVYKYSKTFLTSSAGKLAIENLEWDSYSFGVNKTATGLDLIEVESPFEVSVTQPVDLLAGTTLQEVRLILKAENSLLLTVKDSATLAPIFAASCQVGAEQRPTDEKGQVLFIPLESATYNLEIRAPGYESYYNTVWVSGDTNLTINLTKLP